MNIGEIVAPNRVQLQRDIHSKKRTLQAVSQLLAAGTPSLDEGDILNSLASREKLGSTGMDGGVAIPHGRLRGIEHCIGAFLRIDGGVDYESRDGQKVDLVFGLLVPQDSTEEHLQILQRLAEMFLDEDFCAKVRATTDAQALHRLLVDYRPAATA